MKKNQKISELLENKVVSQKKLDYPNLNTLGDHPLFLDPILILGKSNTSTFAKKCWDTLEDYFSTLFKEIEQGTFSVKSPTLQNLTEKNPYRLGYSEVNPQGNGCSPEMIYTLFTRIGVNHLKELVEKGIIASPMDIALYVKNFSEDRLSDLISNVLFKHFIEFTNILAQKSINASTLKYSNEIGFSWDEKTHTWVKFNYKQLLDQNGEPVILVHKNFVTDEYKYNARRFFQGIVLAHLQEEKKRELNLEKRPSKKSLHRNLQKQFGKGNFYKKDFIIDYILEQKNLELAKKFRKDNINGAMGSNYLGYLSDEKLEEILNKQDDDLTA